MLLEGPGGNRHVRRPHRPLDVRDGQSPSGQALGVELDAHLPGSPAHDRGGTGVGHGLEPGFQLLYWEFPVTQ